MEIQDQEMQKLHLEKVVIEKPAICCYHRGLQQTSESNPVLVLLHGYPQSSYMWRLITLLLPQSSPLFVPDLPGYGQSAPPAKNSKAHVGSTILGALNALLSSAPPLALKGDVPIVLIGHDRGARVCHRLAVSGAPGFNIRGAALMDIAPTTEQWRALGNSRAGVGFFHWPFLANAQLATDMICAYGPSKFCIMMIERWAGSNAEGRERLQSGDALKVYGDFFERPDVVRASCGDYEAGATEDVDLQTEDQGEGKKLKIPTLLIYGADFIGRRFDMEEIWSSWVDESAVLTAHGIGKGIGHFVAEEAPEETAKELNAWLGKILES